MKDPVKLCSLSVSGQETCRVVSQRYWNLRRELVHLLEPTPMRTTEFAPAVPETRGQQPSSSGYGKPSIASSWKADRFSGQDFALQPDGTLRCPTNQSLVAHERRKESDGRMRVVYGASLCSCRPCPLRHQRQCE